MNIKISLPDGSTKVYPQRTTPYEVAKDISPNLAKESFVARINGDLHDLQTPILQDCSLFLLKWPDEGAKHAFWHSSAHLLAEALKSFYPGIKLGIGPPVSNGFYYDVDFGTENFSADDFEKVEHRMLELAQAGNKYIRKEVSKKEAIDFFTTYYDPYKLELLEDLQDGKITFYTQGAFTDLCKGPHIPNTLCIKAIKLLNVAGAYWRGDTKRKQLTRIYGITFPSHKELQHYLHIQEEAKKRNHQKIGKDLKLFTFSSKVGLGLPLWLPNGTIVRQRIMDFIYKDQVKNGYQPVSTPHIGRKELYITSGHYHKYGQDSFQSIKTPNEGEEYFLKPMNCPHHCEIYKSESRSYKDLPIMFCEFGTVYRYEQHGELHGLARTRGLTQDDAHIFCTPNQIKDVISQTIDRVVHTLNALSFKDYTIRTSLHDPSTPDKYIGDTKDWVVAEDILREVLKEKDMKSVEGYGEAAFYGPKLDFIVQDALGRSWQLGTIQLDYQLPKRFELEYTGADNAKHCPVIIHRAPLGSFERLIAILLEHTAGELPLWLAPVQVAILTISENFESYANILHKELQSNEIYSILDNRNQNLNKKILDAELKKIPYIAVIGKNEVENNQVSVRRHKSGDLGKITFTDFVKNLKFEIDKSKSGGAVLTT